MTADDHDRCSELLGAHARGELAGDDARFVRAHLDACERCRDELRALEALAPTGPLTELERARLRSGVRAGLDIAVSRRPLARRLAPGLAAAAAVAVIVTGAYAVLGGSGQRDGSRGSGTLEQADGPDGAARDAGAASPAGPPVFVARAGKLTGAELARLGRRGFTSPGRRAANAALGAAAESGPSAEAAAADEVSVLAALAPTEAAARQVRRCAEETSGAGGGAAPAFAALGRYDGKAALVLGYVRDGDRAARYSIWVWPRGSCDVPLDFVSGAVRR